MKLTICDSKTDTAEELKSDLEHFFSERRLPLPDIHIIPDSTSLLQHSEQTAILFFDIDYPGGDNMQPIRRLKKSCPDVIVFIISSHINALDDAMRLHVFRYLIRPLNTNRLFQNMEDALAAYYTVKRSVLVETRHSAHLLSTEDIVFIEALDRKSVVHTVHGDYTSIYPLQYWTDHLPRSLFFLSHRSCIVNLAYVVSFDHDCIHLFRNRFCTYLAHRKYAQFKTTFLSYVKSMDFV